jgi:hypothetical protein
MTNKMAMRSAHGVAGVNLCPQYEQTRTFSPTVVWHDGQVFIVGQS